MVTKIVVYYIVLIGSNQQKLNHDSVRSLDFRNENILQFITKSGMIKAHYFLLELQKITKIVLKHHLYVAKLNQKLKY